MVRPNWFNSESQFPTKCLAITSKATQRYINFLRYFHFSPVLRFLLKLIPKLKPKVMWLKSGFSSRPRLSAAASFVQRSVRAKSGEYAQIGLAQNQVRPQIGLGISPNIGNLLRYWDYAKIGLPKQTN